MPSVSFRTLGCKLNQAETNFLVSDFVQKGYTVVPFREPSDVFVLNTCAVTGRSEGKCRRLLNRVIRESPETTIIVVGCLAQVAADKLLQIIGIDYILGTQEKHELFKYFKAPGKRQHTRIIVHPVDHVKKAFGKSSLILDHARAFLKIQDGCDERCAYCIVPQARGRSRSIPVRELIEYAAECLERGHQELVLTGVHIGKYGNDLSDGSSLTRLLRELLDLGDSHRIRLTSLEPGEITDELVESVSESPRICRHFHIPLQSGSDTILRAMHRPYKVEEYRSQVEKMVSVLPGAGLGTDVIVGFPGESDNHFSETLALIESLPFTYLHVFPFSSRENTEAAGMSGVDPRVTVRRARLVRELGAELKNRFYQEQVGCEKGVLLEGRDRNDWMSGYTSEYVRVEVPFVRNLVNRITPVRIDEMSGQILRGTVIESGHESM
jgi:threonylcarbamoyladenosine tRNA methylthiotransferase MtaB